MLAVSVSKGSVYYASSKKRREVLINENLRAVTQEVIQAVHNLLSSDRMPAAVNDRRCLNCSLREICKPEILNATSELNQLHTELFSLNPDEET
jgi:CRISPR-associated exonuclease Cas4